MQEDTGDRSQDEADHRTAPSSGVSLAGASLGTTEDIALAKEISRSGGSLDRIPARVTSDQELALVRWEIREMINRRAEWLLHRTSPTSPPADRIFQILREASISRGRTRFDQAVGGDRIHDAIRRALEAGQRLFLALLVGGAKAPNALKTGDFFLPDLSEWVAVGMLGSIARAISEIYPHGASVIAIPDAGLHAADLGFPYTDTDSHLRTLRQDLEALGITSEVLLPDTVALLPSNWPEMVQKATLAARTRIQADKRFEADFRGQVESLAYSINTRLLGWSFDHAVQVYAALAGLSRELNATVREEAADLYRRAEQAGAYYVGVNWSIRTADVAGLASTHFGSRVGYLRLSVHAKPGEPRPALLEANRYARSSGLLPMHSLGVRAEGAPAKYGVAFELTARLRGYRPVHEASTGRFLFYEPIERGAASPAASCTIAA